MFNVDRFIEDCKRAASGTDGHKAVRELLERSVSQPSSVLAALGEPKQAGVQKLYVADDLTILNVIWGPQMVLMPHNHEMWAVIGVYTGREDNIFWRRIPEDRDGKLVAAGARSLAAKDVEALGPAVIHSVTNPVNRLTGALHVYGGDFFKTPRSEWDPESHSEGPYDVEKNMRLFEESNRRL
jgi:predicted metal-dependent enzyme (double-stranded beta helix superfamily)